MPATLADVAAAATKLQDAQRAVSVRSVREALGGGSPNVLASLLRQWRQTQLQFPDTVEAPPQMIAEVAGVAPRLWALALEEARTHVQGDIDRLTVALRDANAATDEVQGLFDESVLMRDQLSEERARASAAAEAMHARCVAVDTHLAHQAIVLAETHAALKRQQETSEQLASKLSLCETTRDHEGAKLRAEIAVRDQQLSDQRVALTVKESALSAANAAIMRLTVDLQRVTDLSTASHQQVADLERQLAVDRATHQERHSSREREVIDLRAQKDLLIGQIGEMQLSRDALAVMQAGRDQLGAQHAEHLAALGPILQRLSGIELFLTPPTPPTSSTARPQ